MSSLLRGRIVRWRAPPCASSALGRVYRHAHALKAVESELRELESKQSTIEAKIAACDARQDLRLDGDLEVKVATKIGEWRTVLTGQVTATRVLLKKLLNGPIVMTALSGKQGYRFDGKIKLDELYSRLILLAA